MASDQYQMFLLQTDAMHNIKFSTFLQTVILFIITSFHSFLKLFKLVISYDQMAFKHVSFNKFQ